MLLNIDQRHAAVDRQTKSIDAAIVYIPRRH